MPRRKRPRRRPRLRGLKQAPKQAWYPLLFLGALALIIVTEQVCKRASKPTPSTKTAKRTTESTVPRSAEIAARYAAIITRAGGDGAWVKRGGGGVRPSEAREPGSPADNQAQAGGEVLALAPASRAILSALERQSAADELRLEIRPAVGRSGSLESRNIRLFYGSEQLCAWRLRVVSRICRAAIVIDDLGVDLKPARELLRVPYGLTFSILPALRASSETAADAHRLGREVILHLPMEPFAPARMSPGPGAIRLGMGETEVERVIEADLASVPYAAGVNNHMGSGATSDRALMVEVMKALARRRLYFIDSRTAGSSVALVEARRAGIPAFYRSVFLDDTERVDYTLGQLRRLRAAILEHGMALAIGHPHPTTITALENFLPELERDDIELVPASQLVRLPEATRLSPPQMAARANGE